jgi:hypothetical protein
MARIAKHMAWDILWAEGTREALKTAAREMFPNFPSGTDFGQLVVQRVEDEIRLHPTPSPDLPQMCEDKMFHIGRVRVSFHIDSNEGLAEVKNVTFAPLHHQR